MAKPKSGRSPYLYGLVLTLLTSIVSLQGILFFEILIILQSLRKNKLFGRTVYRAGGTVPSCWPYGILGV